LKRTTSTWALALMLPALATAQGPDNENPDRFSFRIGAQAFTTLTTRLRLDSETLGMGTEIELEDAANLEEHIQVVRLDGTYNFNRRHHADFAYYDIDREGGRSTTQDISFGDVFFPDQFTEKWRVTGGLEWFDVEAGDENFKGLIDLDFDSFIGYFRGSLGQR